MTLICLGRLATPASSPHKSAASVVTIRRPRILAVALWSCCQRWQHGSPPKAPPLTQRHKPAQICIQVHHRDDEAAPARLDLGARNEGLVIELSADALQELGTCFEIMEHESRRGELRLVRPFGLLAAEQACRVAGVMATWANAPMIHRETAQNAIRLVRYALQNWLTALDGEADPAPDWARTLYRWLAPRGKPMPIRDIPRMGPANIRSANRRDATLAIAEEIGRTLLLAWTGETFQLWATPIWVRNIDIALAVDAPQFGF